MSEPITNATEVLKKCRYALLAGTLLATLAVPQWSAASDTRVGSPGDGSFVVAQRVDPNEQQKGKQKGQQGQQGQPQGQPKQFGKQPGGPAPQVQQGGGGQPPGGAGGPGQHQFGKQGPGSETGQQARWGTMFRRGCPFFHTL